MKPRVEWHPLTNTWVVVTQEANGHERREVFPNTSPYTRTETVQAYIDSLPSVTAA